MRFNEYELLRLHALVLRVPKYIEKEGLRLLPAIALIIKVAIVIYN